MSQLLKAQFCSPQRPVLYHCQNIYCFISWNWRAVLGLPQCKSPAASSVSSDLCPLFYGHRFQETCVGSMGPGGGLEHGRRASHHLYPLLPLVLPSSCPITLPLCPNFLFHHPVLTLRVADLHWVEPAPYWCSVSVVPTSMNATLYIGTGPT